MMGELSDIKVQGVDDGYKRPKDIIVYQGDQVIRR